MKLIVGLGNPGKKYIGTRHNVGFDVLDMFAESIGADVFKDGFDGLYCKCKYFDEDIILLKPQTFMNLSGNSVQPIASFYNIEPKDIIVIHDEMDFDPGVFKIRERGSSGGHNGIKSIIERLGTEEFNRLRIGIGKPEYDSIDFVLGKPKGDEKKLILDAEERAVEALKVFVKEGISKAMNMFNKGVSVG